MNSFEANKIFGAVLGTIFVLFGGSIVAEGLFHSEAPEEPGYEIVVKEDTGGAPAEEEQVVPIAIRLQDADPSAGESAFRQCQACHTNEEGAGNKVGPHLWDVYGRDIASVSDFSYSQALQDLASDGSGVWDAGHLDGFLEDPQSYASGTAMGFAGISDPQDRANMIAYLHTLSNDPAPLPEPSEEDLAAMQGGGEEGEAAAGEGGGEASGEGQAQEGGEGEAASDDQAAASGASGDPQMAAIQGGDPEAGESVFNRCRACHAVGEGAANGVGPELNGIVGEEIASVEGYSFSEALATYGQENGAWNTENLHAWLEGPMQLVEGTKMAFPGLNSDEDIANVIAYLATFNEDGTRAEGQQ